MSNTEDLSLADDQEIQITDLETKKEIYSQNTGEIKEFFENNDDKELYKDILDKLDIKTKEKKQDNQEKVIREKSEKSDLKPRQIEEIQLEKALKSDFAKIQKMVQSGLIHSKQGQNLKKQVLKKAFDRLVQTEKIKRALSTETPKKQQAYNFGDSNRVLEEFSQSNPDFFTSDGRKEVLNYLQSGNVPVGIEELNRISAIIRTVEKAAIDRYLQKAAHEKSLRNSNENAKQRLTANAQKSGFSGNLSRTFTREQIGKMTPAEFGKYEKAIMEALKKGFIK
ncbi:MAG: hypothetical protein PHC64_03285 [Candidatus Gastranaerophilales bacterium]|nr:hypothetical protein [Candidatus Gastranaerophilales bacterium]